MEDSLIEITKENIEELLQQAKKQIPKLDILVVQHIVEQKNPDLARAMTEDQLRETIITLRYTNPICDNCCKKENVRLALCPLCRLTFYCSEECRAQHAEKHAKRCCKLDGPLDNGPQRFVVAEIRK